MNDLKFTTTIMKFGNKGEKTGWRYIEITARQAQKINPGSKTTFRVKGMLDQHAFEKVALLPMGDGTFILPLNGTMRKAIGKHEGESLRVTIELDKRDITLSPAFMKCLKEDSEALAFFNSLPKSHQRYFSKWIDSAKTIQTKTKRIVQAITALAKKQGYGEMIRENKRKY